MRKVSLIIMFLLSITFINAQKKNVNKALTKIEGGKLTEAATLLEPAKENPESKDMARTWYVVGRLWEAAESSQDMAILSKSPDTMGVADAMANYEKAKKMDKILGLEIDKRLYNLFMVCLNNGDASFKKEQYQRSFKYFAYAIKINQDPDVQHQPDSIVGQISYYAGLAAFYAGMYKESQEYLEAARKKSYKEPFVYKGLHYSLLMNKDSAKAEEVILEGIKIFPDSKDMIVDLVNLYIKTAKYDKAAQNLDKAISQDPDNYLYYFTKASLHAQTNNYEESDKAYQMTIQKNSNYFDAYYYLGVLRYNWAYELNNLASETKDDAKYKELIAKRDELYKQALEPLEKSLQLNPNSVDVMESLKKLYYKLKMNDKADQMTKKIEAAGK